MNLDQFTTSAKFLMLALDHRESLVKFFQSEDEIINFKAEIIEALEPQFSALLIDKLGLKAYKTKTKPYIMPLEKSGSETLELEYSAQELIGFGAKGAKLLIKLNPNDKTQLNVALQALNDCKTHNLPFFLEIVTDNTRSSIGNRYGIVKNFIEAGMAPEVWKLEYPGSLAGCQEITKLIGSTPWVLLSGGESFDVFKESLGIAVQGGASGFLAGRALWQEVAGLSGPEKEDFLGNTLPVRFKTIADVVIERR